MIDFLRPFKEFSDIVEVSKKPTLQNVVPGVRSLLATLSPNTTDSLFIVELKKTAKSLLSEKFIFHQLHRVALFLNPKMRSLKPLFQMERDETLRDVLGLIDQISIDTDGILADSALEEHPYNSSGPSAIKKRRTTGLLAAWEDDEMDIQENSAPTAAMELETYKNFPVPAEIEFDLLEWWKTQSGQFPRLSILAKRVFCIPASSASSERNFSAAGLVIDKLRSKINPKNVDDLLFLRSSIDMIM